MNTENTLIALGFVHYPEWDFKNPDTNHYRLEKNGKIFRAHVNKNNGPWYVHLGIVVSDDGKVDKWRDCVSSGSVERKINNSQ